MNGLPYEKVKGMTPMSNKSNNQLKNNMHLQGSGIHHGQPEEDNSGRQQNSRNGHTRMPSLPSSIKGSIGVQGPGLNSNQVQQKRQVHQGMPLNIAANDITFAGNFNQMRKLQGNPQTGQSLN